MSFSFSFFFPSSRVSLVCTYCEREKNSNFPYVDCARSYKTKNWLNLQIQNGRKGVAVAIFHAAETSITNEPEIWPLCFFFYWSQLGSFIITCIYFLSTRMHEDFEVLSENLAGARVIKKKTGWLYPLMATCIQYLEEEFFAFIGNYYRRVVYDKS